MLERVKLEDLSEDEQSTLRYQICRIREGRDFNDSPEEIELVKKHLPALHSAWVTYNTAEQQMQRIADSYYREL